MQSAKNPFCSSKAIAVQKNDSLSVAAVMWGQQHEIDAIRAYKKYLKQELFVEKAGIFNSSCGFLGASPDGVVIVERILSS